MVTLKIVRKQGSLTYFYYSKVILIKSSFQKKSIFLTKNDSPIQINITSYKEKRGQKY
jgi:hypothetical protein